MGAICPKGKISKSRRGSRRASSWTIDIPAISKCPKCGEFTVAHRACKACGTYNKRSVIKTAD